MSDNIKYITIVPAKFKGNSGDIHCIIDCYVNGLVQHRKFESEMIDHIDNPTYLFIGLMFGEGFLQTTFNDAKEFEELFIEKWNILNK